MSQAKINDAQRALVSKIENFVTVTADGGIADADFVSKTLPEGLSQEQLNKALEYFVDLPEAFDVAIAEKAIGVAKENADVQQIKGSFKFNDRIKYTSSWSREVKNAEGEVTSRGVVTGKLTVEASSHHQETLDALSALAADI